MLSGEGRPDSFPWRAVPFLCDLSTPLGCPVQWPLSVSTMQKGMLDMWILAVIFGPLNSTSGVPQASSLPPHLTISCPSLGLLGAVPSSKRCPQATDHVCLSLGSLTTFLRQARALRFRSGFTR